MSANLIPTRHLLMKKRHLVDLQFHYNDGTHRTGEPVPFWRVESHDGYLCAGWIFHQMPSPQILVLSAIQKIDLNRLEDERIAFYLGH